MLKKHELAQADSCLNKAHDEEMIFVLLARDLAAPVAIREWCAERVRLEKNTWEDSQISEAWACANSMQRQHQAANGNSADYDDPQLAAVTSIGNHEGAKYLRRIVSATNDGRSVDVDVYAILEAFAVTCPARAHAVKKLLCCGQRNKGDALADLCGALAAVNRAIELEQVRVAGKEVAHG